MKLAIIGSRNLTVTNLEDYIPPETTEIVSGGAKGIDTVAEEYAVSRNIPTTIIRPDYARYGKFAAPIKRNIRMVDMADSVLAIWDGKSSGTKRTIEYAEKTGKSVTVITL